jgi:MoxR-like ATPase
MSITLKDVKNKAIEANKPYELVEDVLKEVEGFKKYVEELLKGG